MNVTPDTSFMFADHADGSQNGNNTEYAISLTTYPEVYTFSPSSLTFALSINEGAIAPYTDDDIVWSPAYQLVTVTALDMSAITRDPIWQFNRTNTSPLQPTDFDIELGVIMECLDDGDPCDNVDIYNETIDFYSPELRKICNCFFHHAIAC